MMQPDLLQEGAAHHYTIPDDSKPIREAFCSNCSKEKNYWRQCDRSTLTLKTNARQTDWQCPDCKHALFWKYRRVLKSGATVFETDSPRSERTTTM